MPIDLSRTISRAVRNLAATARRVLTVSVAVVSAFAGFASFSAQAENPDIAIRRAAARTDFTNEEIRDGFFKIAFGAELQLDQPAGRVRKFDEPVRIFVEATGARERRSELAKVVADIRSRVNHLDIEVTTDRRAANFVVRLVSERKLKTTIRALYGNDRAKQIQQALNPECLSGIGKDERFRIRRAEVILPVDAGDFTFYDCAYEELLQALGAINDDASVPWTMFNDDVQMGFFDVYDQYLLNILYDPRIRPGMTKDEVDALLPDILSSTRSWVRDINPPRRAESENGPVGRNRRPVSFSASDFATTTNIR
jgi:Protein of unknown function (DUF2927)